MQRIRKGDEVVVIAGRDKGKRGVVLERVDATHLRIEGVNMVKKHVRPNPMQGTTGGISQQTMPIDQSNVMVYNPASGKGDRVGIQVVEGRKQRVFKRGGQPVGAAS